MMKYLETRTCTSKCRSSKHASELNSLITKTSDVQLLLSGVQQCWNCHKIQDEFGKYLIHMAASCGRTELVEWLVKIKKADVQCRTSENGWTSAHCAVFYGHIDTLIALIKNGVNMNKTDYDLLTPLEHFNIDKWLSTKYQPDLHGKSPKYNNLSIFFNENFGLLSEFSSKLEKFVRSLPDLVIFHGKLSESLW